jgi:hypothetical protein
MQIQVMQNKVYPMQVSWKQLVSKRSYCRKFEKAVQNRVNQGKRNAAGQPEESLKKLCKVELMQVPREEEYS